MPKLRLQGRMMMLKLKSMLFLSAAALAASAPAAEQDKKVISSASDLPAVVIELPAKR